MKLYLQNILEDISFENLPIKWQRLLTRGESVSDGDFVRFSQNKTLFDFQQNALKNALKGLWLYFKDKNADKNELFIHYKLNGLIEDFDYDLKKKAENKTAKYLLEYSKDYLVINDKISFAHFINRMSFWMATGSGKTLIIVKLIEILGKLISERELPAGDILFLAHRDDLLEQFKNHVDEFNSFNFKTRINLKSLREYDSVKKENALPLYKSDITVFYYRSDLISDEHKEKIVNFKNYDNGGQWYILLDEAHKGDKEDSKRQILYSILSRNGFLFNFSATFTDPRDFATCVFNFNLSKFVEEGYGKHIYVSEQDVSAFREESDFSKQEKQKIVLKVLLLQAYINKSFNKILGVDTKLYHRPLLLTLVNSVNKPDADLQLFFRELEKLAAEEPQEHILQSAKEELIREFSQNPSFYFEEGEKVVLDIQELKDIGYKDILRFIFNSSNSGKIEVSFRPSDKSQVAFKLTTSDRYFALIKTGEMPEWLKKELSRFNINHRFETEGFFETLNNEDSDINILMGSRSFYEGWDSNRPNIILFVNIGVGSDAKKFVLQSVGRGVRIEPLPNQRKRLKNLFNARIISKEIYEKLKDLVLPIESLFVFGTNAENLKEIIATLTAEKQDKNLGELFIINPEAQKHTLLVPVYKTADKIFAEENDPHKFLISRDDFDITSRFYDFLGDKIALVKYDCDVKVLKKVKESFIEKDRYYDFNERISLLEPELILERIFDYLGVKSKEIDKFKELEDEIVHFKKIRFIGSDEYERISVKIKKVKTYPEKDLRLQQLKLEFKEHPDIDKYTAEVQNVEREYVKESEVEYNTKRITIKYLANHYYIPVILSESEKIDYLSHIINVPSEVRFIEQLEYYLAKPNNVFMQFDWWMFSKLDQTLDEVFIPYYNPMENNISKFKPDFVFWAQKGEQYLILFVDPKSSKFSEYQHKVDGFRRIFEGKVFSYERLRISTNLLLYTQSIADIGEGYRKYWFDNFDNFAKKFEAYFQFI